MLPNNNWSPQQWNQQLGLTQAMTMVTVGDLKGKLEFCLRAGNSPWGKTYECLRSLDQLEESAKSADLLRGWKSDPVKAVQETIKQIQAFQMPVLDPDLVELQLLSNDLKALLEHSVS
jgi:hypothetical protein